ncbi:unnamed protein product [Adineta steineri]|uniref:Uncharacterized protein n=2 Tax=Adineta steineri TaxID=433720 RepID=A0A820ERL6_9BILA|nr:unnamed protein product [Adineta steineri]CAF1181219.1 unnamed protein product [Adineta steineri]CAF1416483.1 unnamed protein product [Adineta steineri]CAF4250454.1 unnamed protein product [Adineta steineri]
MIKPTGMGINTGYHYSNVALKMQNYIKYGPLHYTLIYPRRIAHPFHPEHHHSPAPHLGIHPEARGVPMLRRKRFPPAHWHPAHMWL